MQTELLKAWEEDGVVLRVVRLPSVARTTYNFERRGRIGDQRPLPFGPPESEPCQKPLWKSGSLVLRDWLTD